jgi:signal transduction histidine kinase
MRSFVLVPLFAAFVNLSLAVFVLTRDVRLRINQVFFLWCVGLGVWNIGAFALFRVTDLETAVFWARFTQMGVIWLPAAFLHLSILVTKTRIRPWILPTAYAVSAALALSDLTPLFVHTVRRLEYAWFSVAGPAFYVFGNVFYPLIVIPAFWLLLKHYRSASLLTRRKLATLLAADALITIFGTHDLLPVFGFDTYPGTRVPIYPWGTLSASIYGLLVSYSVLHDQVLDIRLSLGRQAATVVRLCFLVAVTFLLLFVAAALAPKGAFTVYTFAASMTALVCAAVITGRIFPKLLGGVGEGIERRLLGDRFEYQDQIRALSDTVHRHANLNDMWAAVSDALTANMRVAPVCCLLLGARKFAVELRGVSPAMHPAGEKLQEIGADCAILRYFNAQSGRVLDTRMEPGFRFGPARALLHEARAEAKLIGAEYVFALPGSERVFGFLAVGPKKDEVPTTAADIELLAQLAQRMGWATERTILAAQVGLAQRHELLSMMSRGLAHDLNNLLTPVSTVIQLSAGRYESGSNEDQLLEAAENSVRVIRDYVEEAIFFAKDLQPRMTRLELGLLLNDVRSVVEGRAENRGVEMHWHASDGALVGDGVLCQRMLANLVNNAIDASSRGRQVRVEARVDALRRVARFVVSDDGTGIPPEQQALVFQPYFTTKDSGDHDGQRGFGLGLTVCQLIVELHQGVITLQSELGKGTSVTVELPLEGAGPPAFVPKHVPL